jgi:hypothetical protein
MHWWRRSRDVWAGRTLFGIIIVEDPGEATGNTSLHMRRSPLLQFSRILINKAEQYMVIPYALAHMTNTRMFPLHPGVDYGFQRGHVIAALCAIKAFKPIHLC